MTFRLAVSVIFVGLAATTSALTAPAVQRATQTASTIDNKLATFERYLTALARQSRLAGLSATVVSQGSTVWERGLGYRDVESRLPATPDTLYQVASLTKTFTSTLLLQCVERGQLNLDAPIAQFTSEIREPGATVRHVLTHTSAGTPGGRFAYDGDRFLALTSVVEQCHGLPYRVALTTSILDRLGMADSVPGQDLDAPSPALRALFDQPTLDRYASALTRLAKPYVPTGRASFKTGIAPPKGIFASAGLVTSVRDLVRYDRALDDSVLLLPATQDLAWTQARTTAGAAIPYGLGWFVQSSRGERIVWHYGLFGSYSALYLKIPGRRLSLIVLANGDGLSAQFPLALGDVTRSPYARTFLSLFQ
jgi:CubicO group peptidase (beta-lactamase class C family)